MSGIPPSGRDCYMKSSSVIGSFFLLCFLAAQSGALGRAAEPSPGGNVTYEVVPGWPRLPDAVELGPVSAVSVGPEGRVFVLHRGEGDPVLCFDREGKFLFAWGQGRIQMGHGLKLDPQGFVWVTDIGHHQVYKFSPEGDLLQEFGSKDDPGDRLDQFNEPTDVAFSATGDIYITDGYGNSRILKFDSKGKLLRTWGHPGRDPGEFRTPHAICVDPRERIYVSDRTNDRIQVFDSEGRFLEEWFNLPYMDGLFCAPDGTLFAATGRDNQILRLDSHGVVLESHGGPRSTEADLQNNVRPPAGRFNVIHGITLDAEGSVYAAEVRARRVQKILRRGIRN